EYQVPTKVSFACSPRVHFPGKLKLFLEFIPLQQHAIRQAASTAFDRHAKWQASEGHEIIVSGTDCGVHRSGLHDHHPADTPRPTAPKWAADAVPKGLERGDYRRRGNICTTGIRRRYGGTGWIGMKTGLGWKGHLRDVMTTVGRDRSRGSTLPRPRKVDIAPVRASEVALARDSMTIEVLRALAPRHVVLLASFPEFFFPAA
ncbi:unnamed protein product, partial [Scytosiphon promiscuus]